MSKAQTIDNLPNNFVMRSDSLYCCRTGKGIMNVNSKGVSGNIPAILAELIGNGEVEMRSYPGRFQLTMEHPKVQNASVLLRWGRRQKNGPYVQLAGYSVSVHNVKVLESVGLQCKVETRYTPNIVDIPTKPEPTKEPVVDSEYLFGSAPEVSKGDVGVLTDAVSAFMEPDTPSDKPRAKIDHLWPIDELKAHGGYMKYKYRLQAALDLSEADSFRVVKRVWDLYKSGDLSRRPVEIANTMLNEPVKVTANKPVSKPAIEMPAPPTEGGTVVKVPFTKLKAFMDNMEGAVVVEVSDTDCTVRLSS